MFLLLVAVLNVLTFINFIPTNQELIHWLKPVGVRVSVEGFEIDYGVSMSFP